MVWNSNEPMKLLADMPTKLSRKNLGNIQSVIDKDKFICSLQLQRDLCGEYAPFCALCDKTISTPCAVAFVKMKQAEGLQLEIAATEDTSEAELETIEISTENEIIILPSEDTKPDESVELIVSAEEPEQYSVQEISEPDTDVATEKIKIRIAIAKRKN